MTSHEFREAAFPIALVIGAVLSLPALWGSLRSLRRHRLIRNLPSSKVQGVFMGLSEVKGTAESETPLVSYLAEKRCVYYQFSVKEHWSRTVIESYTDSDGKRKTRTRHESGWETLKSGTKMIPFHLQDETGALRVIPEGADIDAVEVFSRQCGRSDPLYYGKGPSGSVTNSDHYRQFTEHAIPLHRNLYVLGQAREREDVVAPEIAADPNAEMFLISCRSEQKVASRFFWGSWGWGVLGLILVIAGTYIDIHQRYPRAHATSILPGLQTAGAWLLAWGLAWCWMVYNEFVNLRQRVLQAWSLVDIQLKRRNDLIPNLVGVVKGFRDYEKSLQTELAALRNQLTATPPGQPGPDPGGCRPIVGAILERYPDLKAQPAFLKLQEELAETEERIALARSYFNEIATHYNTRLESIPDGWISALSGMKPRALMQAADFERAPVQVTFAA